MRHIDNLGVRGKIKSVMAISVTSVVVIASSISMLGTVSADPSVTSSRSTPAVYDVRNDSSTTMNEVHSIVAKDKQSGLLTTMVLDSTLINGPAKAFDTYQADFVRAANFAYSSKVVIDADVANTHDYSPVDQGYREANTKHALSDLSELVTYGDSGQGNNRYTLAVSDDGLQDGISPKADASLLKSAGWNQGSNQEVYSDTSIAAAGLDKNQQVKEAHYAELVNAAFTKLTGLPANGSTINF